MKTLAFEIAEELARQNDDPGSTSKWQAPDWYIQAVSGGIGPLGVNKGFEELYRMGLIDRMPKIGVVQVDGCAPMVRAFRANQSTATGVVPETRITVLSTGIPGPGYEILYRASQKYGGHMTSVSDDDAFKAMRSLARTEGFSVEPAAAVAFAGLEKMIKMGVIKPEETVVVNCSGHTFPVEKHIMSEDVVIDLALPQKNAVYPDVPVDGLGGALNQLDEQITTIVVIDDNPMDTRLIKRLLQSRKPYRIFEAANASEGLEIINEREPDLVITDLSMPGMDGFTLVERLKQKPETASIPVIVVTAKDLTPEDEFHLASQTSSIWLKGAFSTHDLVEHVVDTLSGNDNRLHTAETAASAHAPAAGVEKTVVLVEDNPMDARLISRILQVELPLKIRQVQSGTAALDVIRAEKPHLIILDLVIPGKNGFQILFELKQDKTLDTIPVIVITSKELAEYEKEMLIANGVSSLWQKGQIDRKKLVAQVEAQLD